MTKEDFIKTIQFGESRFYAIHAEKTTVDENGVPSVAWGFIGKVAEDKLGFVDSAYHAWGTMGRFHNCAEVRRLAFDDETITCIMLVPFPAFYA